MKKRIRLTIVLLVIIILVATLGLFGIMNKDQHKILTKKFYIPIKESYEIVFFESESGDDLEKHCYSELKVSESEYDELVLEIEKAEYSRDPLEWYDIYLENKSDWIPGEKVVAAYSKDIVEMRYIIVSNRIHMNIFVTESKDGYRQIYMLRN